MTSSTVLVAEAPEGWNVICLAGCLEAGDPLLLNDEGLSRKDAEAVAREHRQWHRDEEERLHGSPVCPACKRPC